MCNEGLIWNNMPYEIWSVCPRCAERADGLDEIEEKFGFRVVTGKRVPQSYCHRCRSS